MIKMLPIVLCASLIGCSNHLVYVNETSMGVNLSVGSGGVSKLSVGYDRDTFAAAPRNETKKNDAVSVYSAGIVRVDAVNDVAMCQMVATGASAEKIAQNPNTVTSIQARLYGDDSNDSCLNIQNPGDQRGETE